MREPQVVRSVRVHRMSLCATGIPASGPPSPLARRSSARRAASRLCEGSTVMNALRSRCASMRARQSCVSSRAEIFLAASAAESSVTVELSKLLNDLGDEVQALFHRGGDGLVQPALVALGDLVGAQPLNQVQRVGHRFDPGGVDRLDLADQLEYPGHAAGHLPGFAWLEGDPGEAREAADLVVGKRHRLSMKWQPQEGAARGVFPFDSGATLAYYIGHLRLCCRAQKQEKASACPCSDSFAATSRTILRSTLGPQTR